MTVLAQELKVRPLHSDFVIEIDERIEDILANPTPSSRCAACGRTRR